MTYAPPMDTTIELIRWPRLPERPVVLVGGFTIEEGGSRYCHLGPLWATADREWHGGYALYASLGPVSMKIRFR